jgi:hypothetical protein
MANITRIRTNQISDGNVTAAKIASGTLTGTLFAPSLTLNSNLTVLGNLSVSGNTSTINSVNTYIQDPLVVFNNGYTGSINGYDIGFIVNRNYATLSQYGAVQTAWVWVENDQAFEAIATTSSGNALTTLTTTGFANLKVGNITAPTLTSSGTVSAGLLTGPLLSTAAGITTGVVTNFSTANAAITGGYASGLSSVAATFANVASLNISGNVIGHLIPSANVTYDLGSASYRWRDLYLNGSTIYLGSAAISAVGGVITTSSAVLSGQTVVNNLSTGNILITGGDINGLTTLQAAKAVFTNFSTGNALVTNAGFTTAVATNLSTANVVLTGGYATGLANVQATNISGTTGVITNFSTANAQITSGSATTLVATNFSSANAVITGGYISSVANVQSPTAGFGTTTTGVLNTTSGNVTNLGSTTAVATNFSTANAQITSGSATTLVVTNFSSGNITGTFNGTVTGTIATANVAIYDAVTALTTNQTFYPMFSNTSATGNTISGVNSSITVNPSTGTLGATAFTGTSASVTNIGATTLVSTNLSSANAQITSGSATTLVATNLSSGNAVISGGSANGLTTLAATTATATNFSTANAQITSGLATTLVATNFSSANAVITGGTFSGITSTAATTATFTNLSSGNAVITGGSLTGDVTVQGTTGQFTNLSSGNVQLNGSDNNGLQYTSGVLQITGGAGISGNLYVSGNVYAGNLISTTTQILEVTDPLLYLNASTPGTYNYEIGVYSHFGPTGGLGYQHTGFVRDHNDYTWKLFSNVPEPSGGTVNLTNAIYDTLKLGALLAVNTTSSTSTTTGALIVSGGAGIAGQLYAAGINGTTGSIGTLVASTGFSSGNAVITSAGITTGVVTNLSSGNAVITGGSATGLINLSATNASATTLVATNFSSGNAVITNSGTTTGVVTNFSSGNAVITGGSANGLTTLGATTGVVTNLSSGNVIATNLSSTTAVVTNLSSGNAVISGGSANGLTTLSATTATATNLSSANAIITNISGTTGVITNFSTANAQITSGSATTLVATNLSTANAVITSGYVTGLANLQATNISGTTGVFTNFSSGNITGTFNGTVTGTIATANVASYANIQTTSSSSTYYPAFYNATSGNLAAYTNSSLSFRPSDGYLFATVACVAAVFGDRGTITSLVATNFSTGNALITGGTFSGITSTAATTATFTNLSSGNAVITGGYATGLANLQATNLSGTTGVITNFSTANAQITSGSATTLVATNFSSANAVITGGYITTANIATTGTAVHNGNIVAAATTASTSTTTGALVVAGGVGIVGNITSGNAAVFNSSQTAGMDFIVKGKNDGTLIWGRPNTTYDSVIIGNSATASTAVNGSKLVINSTDSILLPVGSSGQRPGQAGYTDTTGMLRYSTTQGTIEWYTGSVWQGATTQFTTITAQQFNGDGSTTVFTLSQPSTTAGILVSINGVVQIPGAGYAYSVSGGTTLTFTEAPAVGDLIDVRIITTTGTVNNLSSGTNTTIDVSSDYVGVLFKAGTSTSSNVAIITPTGAFVTTVANTAVASANAPTTVDTMDNNLYRSGKYVVQASINGQYQVMEALVISNGTTATVTTYGTIGTGANLGVLSATQSGTNTLVQFIAANASTNVRVKRDYLLI